MGLPEILEQNGHAMAAFGKWHNTPKGRIEQVTIELK
jgi:arylsulfatase A-like enzyme